MKTTMGRKEVSGGPNCDHCCFSHATKVDAGALFGFISKLGNMMSNEFI